MFIVKLAETNEELVSELEAAADEVEELEDDSDESVVVCLCNDPELFEFLESLEDILSALVEESEGEEEEPEPEAEED